VSDLFLLRGICKHSVIGTCVLRSELDAFAAHLESLWSFGYAKIERQRKLERVPSRTS